MISILEQDGSHLLAHGSSARLAGCANPIPEAAQILNQAFELRRLAAAVDSFQRDKEAARLQSVLAFNGGFVAAFEVSIPARPPTRTD